MKLYIDDERIAPEGWVQAWSMREALSMVDEHHEEITHMAFDWQLSKRLPEHDGIRLLQELAQVHYFDQPIFTQPRENYTCHSSDDFKRREMESILDKIFASTSFEQYHSGSTERTFVTIGQSIYLGDSPDKWPPKSRLERLRKSKGRR